MEDVKYTNIGVEIWYSNIIEYEFERGIKNK